MPAPIDLFHLPTSNAQKVAIVLEETGLPYVAHRTVKKAGEATPAAHLAMNPIGKYPVIVDPDGPGGKPITIFETSAIALYLAEKSGKLLPADLRGRAAVNQWISVGASIMTIMAAQWFTTKRAKTDLSEATDWIVADVNRGLQAIDLQLGETIYLTGADFTVADALVYPVMATTVQRIEGGYAGYDNIARWATLVGARPGVVKAMALGV